jgi:hypothetical protein
MFARTLLFSRLAGGIAVATVAVVVSASSALAAHDPWYSYATSLTHQATAQRSIGHDSWYWYLLSLSRQATSVAAGKPKASAQDYRFVTDTLGSLGHGMTSVAAGKPRPSTRDYRFVTDTLGSLGHGMTSVVAGKPVASLTSPPVPAAQHSPRFSWVDAAVGAGTAVGGLLVLLGGSLLVARRHSRLAI